MKLANSGQNYRSTSAQGFAAVEVVTISGKMDLFWALCRGEVEIWGRHRSRHATKWLRFRRTQQSIHKLPDWPARHSIGDTTAESPCSHHPPRDVPSLTQATGLPNTNDFRSGAIGEANGGTARFRRFAFLDRSSIIFILPGKAWAHDSLPLSYLRT